MKLAFLICSLVLTIVQKYWSQNGLVKHFGVEDGLTSNRVYTAFQDRKGYIWLATTNGVSRFDGKEFKNYTSNNGLPDNDIFDIAEDGLGRIWLSCYNGEPCYIYNNKVFTTLEDPLLKQIPQKGYFRFSHLANKLILTKSANGVSYEVDKAGNLRRTTLQGIYFISFKKNLLNVISSKTNTVLTYYLLNPAYEKVDSLSLKGNPLKFDGVVEIEELCASGEDSFVILLKDGRCLRYEIHNNKIAFLTSTQKTKGFTNVYHEGGKLWINAHNRGIIPVTDQFTKDPKREVLFAQQAIQNFMIDREGNYWASTSGKGLFMIPNNNFSYYNTSSDPEQNDILKLTSHHREIYLGCATSILNYQGGNKSYGNSFNTLNLLQGRIVDMYCDSINVIAATTECVLICNKKNKQVKKIPVNNIKCMHKGSGHSLLFGTHSGCYHLSFPDKLTTIFNGRTVAVYPRKNGDVLIGTLNGLFVARKNKHGLWISDSIKSPAILKKTRISCIEEIDKTIVVGTVQKGLVLINGSDYEDVNLGPGLNDINCKALFIDADKTIWLASFSGIFKITLNKSIHSYQVQNIRKFNGLLSDDVNDILVLNDTVYVAGSNGLTTFSLKKFSNAKKDTLTLFINDVRVNGIPYPSGAKQIHLPSDSTTIDLHFSAIDYKSLSNILFKYRLSNVQKNWHYSTDNFARFESLSPGDYTFEVMAMNAENMWSSKPVTLLIRISPAWWQTLWFSIILILAGAGLVYFIIRRSFVKKHHTHMRESFLKRHMTELELRALKAQINPHFIFNTLNAIQYFIGNNENEKAENYLNRMADLLRKTLDFSDKTTVPLHAEINYLENYLELEKLRFDENFIFTITNNLPSNQNKTEIPPMVLQPHIENALRHGFKNRNNVIKKLDITFNLVNNQLVCEVLDNGIGRMAAATDYKNETHYRSRGMELSHSKLLMYESITGKTIKTDIQDNYVEDTQTATGTLIRISISQ